MIPIRPETPDPAPLTHLHPAVFLDRDGTLNIDDYVTYQTRQFQLIAGVSEGLIHLKRLGFDLVVVTNQSGIGRGDYTAADMTAFHQLLIAALAPIGLTLDNFYHCPHDPHKETCRCCKPNPGLLLQAAKDRLIDLGRSYMIGDKHSDILAGKRAGCKKTILVTTGITDDRQRAGAAPDFIVDNLIEAAQIIAELEGLANPSPP